MVECDSQTEELRRLHLLAQAKVAELRDELAHAPRLGFSSLHYSPDSGELAVELTLDHESLYAPWRKLGCQRFDYERWQNELWIPLARNRELVKTAEHSEVLRGLLGLAGYAPSFWTGPVPGAPGPIVGGLAGGLLGAGLGYGAGWLGSRILPESWDRDRLPKVTAMLGGLAGATPGLIGMADNIAAGRPVGSTVLFDKPDLPVWPNDYRMAAKAHQGPPLPDLIKEAFTSVSGLFGPPVRPIPIDAVQQMVWQDPHVSTQLTPQLQLATGGLAEAAWLHRQRTTGDSTRLIWPSDIARITAGMGSGYVSGAIVGKTLGVLLGMPESIQDRLKTTGMWAGAVRAVVPMAFGVH